MKLPAYAIEFLWRFDDVSHTHRPASLARGALQGIIQRIDKPEPGISKILYRRLCRTALWR